MEQGSDVLVAAGAEAHGDAAGVLSAVDEPADVLMAETDAYVVGPALSGEAVATQEQIC